MQFILGSQSPRRKEILSYFSVPFIQIPSSFDENSVIFKNNPEEYASALSRGKAADLAKKHPDAIILTADTIVYCQGKVYNKPKDEEECYQTLKLLAGQWQTVYTGVTVQQGTKAFHQVEASHVLFNDLTSEQIRHYLLKTKWSDKAGGYSIQMTGGLVVRKIDGCYYNILGLPINTTASLLKHFDIDLWKYLKEV